MLIACLGRARDPRDLTLMEMKGQAAINDAIDSVRIIQKPP